MFSPTSPLRWMRCFCIVDLHFYPLIERAFFYVLFILVLLLFKSKTKSRFVKLHSITSEFRDSFNDNDANGSYLLNICFNYKKIDE